MRTLAWEGVSTGFPSLIKETLKKCDRKRKGKLLVKFDFRNVNYVCWRRISLIFVPDDFIEEGLSECIFLNR